MHVGVYQAGKERATFQVYLILDWGFWILDFFWRLLGY